MDKKFIFCTGGSRSGKSAFALREAGRIPGSKLFIATGAPKDPEMAARIQKHRAERGKDWTCLEVPISKSCSIHEFMLQAKLPVSNRVFSAVLFDCVSTWVSACQESWPGAPCAFENAVKDAFRDLLALLRGLDAPVFMVSAEVGLGLVSIYSEARQFSDLLGYVNQMAAREADEAYFCVSGIPMRIK